MSKLISQTKTLFSMDDGSEFNIYNHFSVPAGLDLNIAEHVKFVEHDSCFGWRISGGDVSLVNNTDTCFEIVYPFQYGKWMYIGEYNDIRLGNWKETRYEYV